MRNCKGLDTFEVVKLDCFIYILLQKKLIVSRTFHDFFQSTEKIGTYSRVSVSDYFHLSRVLHHLLCKVWTIVHGETLLGTTLNMKAFLLRLSTAFFC